MINLIEIRFSFMKVFFLKNEINQNNIMRCNEIYDFQILINIVGYH